MEYTLIEEVEHAVVPELQRVARRVDAAAASAVRVRDDDVRCLGRHPPVEVAEPLIAIDCMRSLFVVNAMN